MSEKGYEWFHNIDWTDNDEYRKAVKEHPVGSWIYITTTNQVVKIQEVRGTPDGVRFKTDSGSIPIAEIRKPTEEQILNRNKLSYIDREK